MASPVGLHWILSTGPDLELAAAAAAVVGLGIAFGLVRSAELQWASRRSAVRLEGRTLLLTGGSEDHRVDVGSVVNVEVEQGYSWWDLAVAGGAESLPRVLVITDDGRLRRSGPLGFWGDPEPEVSRLKHDVQERRHG
ncbi:hypothetical protein INN71_09500 [Nocardioides sp. ChNu-153]|uniref:hypothetical protein n=1 Tax=Nocardioides sp. ChNu-153 TaxID=2779364 RepID=UPI002656032B|nr:hypothetical protein [Nocardioides sp. ChNu-153]MDN7121624.1 hypothetical protein [Nocardioides sp. ChNu-153]